MIMGEGGKVIASRLKSQISNQPIQGKGMWGKIFRCFDCEPYLLKRLMILFEAYKFFGNIHV